MNEEFTVKFLAEYLSISEKEAALIYKSFWEVIKMKLEKDGEAEIEGLGRFYLEEKELKFESSESLQRALNPESA